MMKKSDSDYNKIPNQYVKGGVPPAITNHPGFWSLFNWETTRLEPGITSEQLWRLMKVGTEPNGADDFLRRAIKTRVSMVFASTGTLTF